MRTTSIFRPTVWGLALGLLAFAGAAQAQGGTGDKDKEIKKKTRIVVINKDGEQQVIEGDGGNLPRVRRGYLGVGLTELTSELRAHFGAPEGAGVMVSRVEAGSPAEKAGIKVGDILTSLDGDKIEAGWDVRSKVRDYGDGQQVPVEVVRGGRAQTLNVTVVQKERPEVDLSHLFTEEGGRRVLRLPAGEMMDGMRLQEPLVIPLDGNETVTPGGVRIRRFHEREAELQKQLEEMEKRLNELERQLKKQQ
ncbi:MAG TPA: PDZ domain-containing protein [Thermoanaerobaculia bacterium]|nr:PDZ domain-containing protein [Thermoanaerobaculia bacterium]